MTDDFDPEQLELWRVNRRQHDFSAVLARKGWYHSFELPDGKVVDGCVPLEELRRRISCMPIPPDLTGKRVLDIGAWDGWFSFEMERRGAEVMAIDCVEVLHFREIHRALRSRVDYRTLDLYDLSPADIGHFDVVLFLSVLYHVKHPLLALEKVCALTTDVAIVSSFITDDTRRDPRELLEEVPRLEFYETDELGGQLDNWCGPNLACLVAMCRAAGFARVQLIELRESSAVVACFRKWEPRPPSRGEDRGSLRAAALSESGGTVPAGAPASPAPVLIDALHCRTNGINFGAASDDYISCWFTSGPDPLSREAVYPEVAGYGVPAVFLRRHEGGVWQTNFRLPPGLDPGWQSVRLRCGDSAWSNEVRIALDMAVVCDELSIRVACDAATYERNLLHLGANAFVSIWVAGLPDNADRANVRVTLDEIELATVYVATDSPQDRQVNAAAPPEIRPGTYSLRTACAGRTSPPVPIELRFM